VSRKYRPQNVGCGTDDRGKDVFWHPTYRESEPLFGHFTNHECLFGHNPDKPLLHAFFDEALYMNIGIPRVFGVAIDGVIVCLKLEIPGQLDRQDILCGPDIQ
jgi:hypothetical protein